MLVYEVADTTILEDGASLEIPALNYFGLGPLRTMVTVLVSSVSGKMVAGLLRGAVVVCASLAHPAQERISKKACPLPQVPHML